MSRKKATSLRASAASRKRLQSVKATRLRSVLPTRPTFVQRCCRAPRKNNARKHADAIAQHPRQGGSENGRILSSKCWQLRVAFTRRAFHSPHRLHPLLCKSHACRTNIAQEKTNLSTAVSLHVLLIEGSAFDCASIQRLLPSCCLSSCADSVEKTSQRENGTTHKNDWSSVDFLNQFSIF